MTDSPVPQPLTVIELYERLLERRYKPVRTAHDEHGPDAKYREILKLRQDTEPSEDFRRDSIRHYEDMLKIDLELDFPEVFYAYYYGLTNPHRKKGKGWVTLMCQAVQEQRDHYRARDPAVVGKPYCVIDFILQNP